MAFVSAYKHKIFVEALDNAIKQFEALGPKKFAYAHIIQELKIELFLLENIYAECDAKTKLLRELNAQYQDIHGKARIKLRNCLQIYSKL